MPRVLLLVLDSVGIGNAPDAAQYGDEGADTVGNIAVACAEGRADREGLRAGPLKLPHLVRLGLGEAIMLAGGRCPPGLASTGPPQASFGCAAELSKGKDTPRGTGKLQAFRCRSIGVISLARRPAFHLR